MELQSLVEAWSGLAVVMRHDRPTGAWIFIALHDDTLGRPTGGTRIKLYPAPAAGLEDALRLAEGMTHKWAAVDFPFGGGKAVLSLTRPLEEAERRGLLTRYGRLVASLKGAFATGEDLGTTPEDMVWIGRYTSHVMGGHVPGQEGAGDPGPFTSRGVFTAIRTTLRHAGDSNGLAGRTVLIQGVGDVGAPLARQLAEAGAKLLLSDLDPSRAAAVAGEVGGEVVAPDEVFDTPCDVFAPCAVGAVLNRESIPRLRCRAVAGSANNQLAEDTDADRLHERGILYAPDYVANAGGAIAFGLLEQGERRADALFARVEGIGPSLDEIFEQAAAEGTSPLHASRRRVEKILERGRQRRREEG